MYPWASQITTSCYYEASKQIFIAGKNKWTLQEITNSSADDSCGACSKIQNDPSPKQIQHNY